MLTVSIMIKRTYLFVILGILMALYFIPLSHINRSVVSTRNKPAVSSKILHPDNKSRLNNVLENLKNNYVPNESENAKDNHDVMATKSVRHSTTQENIFEDAEKILRKENKLLKTQNDLLKETMKSMTSRFKTSLKQKENQISSCRIIQNNIKKSIANILTDPNLSIERRQLIAEIEIALYTDVESEDTQNKLLTPVVKAQPFLETKLIHLDLKGAPPKIEYLLWLIKHMRQYGANGILIEYEDMFPWSGELEVIASKHAYSEKEIDELQKIASEEGMVVIPLIQSFGHMEFVLKHKNFHHLRATKYSNDTISAMNKGSVPLVKKMIDQILELHPLSPWVHIGGDEVHNIHKCNGCTTSELTKSELYLHHMTPLLKYLKSKAINPIIWDDMIRNWKLRDLQKLKDLAYPMVWNYNSNLGRFGESPPMWRYYSFVFPKIWVASSFKGALLQDTNHVPIRRHLSNSLSWLNTHSKITSNNITTLGIALTGWSRFWHYAPLCELLPAAIPSLALCLTVLQNGTYNKQIHQKISNELGFNKTFFISDADYINFRNYEPEEATYPGGDLYNLVGHVEKTLDRKYEIFNTRMKSSLEYMPLTNYFGIEVEINDTLKQLQSKNKEYKQLKLRAIEILNRYYDRYVVEEWVEEKIGSLMKEVTISIKDAEESLAFLRASKTNDDQNAHLLAANQISTAKNETERQPLHTYHKLKKARKSKKKKKKLIEKSNVRSIII